jgi:gas vesicle protein
MADKNNSAVVGAMMLVAGGVIGAGLALLYAPQSGERTRKQISRYTRKVRNETEEMMRDAAHAVTDMAEELGDKTSELAKRGGEVAEDWRQHLLDSIEQGQKSLEKQRKKLMQLWG